MNRHPNSWLHQLLGAAIMLALSVWLIRWAVAALLPLLVPAVAPLAVGFLATLVIGWLRRRRQEW